MLIRLVAIASLAFLHLGCSTIGVPRAERSVSTAAISAQQDRDDRRPAAPDDEATRRVAGIVPEHVQATAPPPVPSPTTAEASNVTQLPAGLPTAAPSPVMASPTAPPTQASRPLPVVPSRAPSVLVSADEVGRGDPSRPWVSLVFNAGAGFRPATAILETLGEKQIRTTFFLMGWWAEGEPALVRQIAAAGHEIASHGYEVFDLTAVSDAAVIADLERADDVIKSIAGKSTRPLWSPSAGYRDLRVRRIAAELGFRPIYWTLDSGDWREESTAREVHSRVMAGVVNGAIIVMHFDSPRSADTIAGALPGIIDSLQARGYRLVSITELITGQLRATE